MAKVFDFLRSSVVVDFTSYGRDEELEHRNEALLPRNFVEIHSNGRHPFEHRKALYIQGNGKLVEKSV